ncbi:MAG TPA: hypothetical protein VG675_15605 [Bryobacteraceae bacterium]|nr:hypothetical protein [Bryobacteraceae bacterium]
MLRPIRLLVLALLAGPVLIWAQTSPELASILQRLDRLEQQNQELMAEVKALRAELAQSKPATATPATATPATETVAVEAPSTETPSASPLTPQERLDIQEHRIDEQAQTKVEASQKFPIRLTGMALFNAFTDSRQNGGVDYPLIAAPTGPARAGATLRQTILGLEFLGPQTVWGGKVSGSAYMDFFTGSTTRDQYLRLRTASMQIDWKTRSVMAGLEKPIFNPREPSSLAQVGVSPLTGAGNLWLWLPQVRVEQDLTFGSRSGLRAQMGVVETREIGPYSASNFTGSVEAARPGLEGRYDFYRKIDDDRRIEIAPGFHASTTHVDGFSVPSNLFSMDWFANPWRRLEFTGAFFSGQNVANLGTGGIRQGYLIYGQRARPIHSRGGWGQLTLHTTNRLDFHFFTGQEDDRNSELTAGSIGKNLLFGGNLYYRLAPNVIVSLETTQVRTVYLGSGVLLNNHYDLALAYMF